MSHKNHEKLSVAFAIQNSDLEQNSFSGMASVFNNLIDAWMPTRILPGAFTKTLQENKSRIKVLYQHSEFDPIGLPTKMEENADGLYVEAKISQTTRGKDTMILLKDKVITEMSIGFDPIKHSTVQETIEGLLVPVRHITECRLWEFSPVTFGANSRALISNVNSLFGLGNGPDVELTPDMLSFTKTLINELREHPEAEPVDLMLFTTRRLSESHEGKVLSAKNRTLVTDAITALQKLVDAAEPKEEKQSRSLFSLTAMEEQLRNAEVALVSSRRL